MNTAVIAGVIRTALAAVGGALVGTGIIDQDTANQASGNLETILGSLSALGALGWSIWSKLSGEGK